MQRRKTEKKTFRLEPKNEKIKCWKREREERKKKKKLFATRFHFIYYSIVVAYNKYLANAIAKNYYWTSGMHTMERTKMNTTARTMLAKNDKTFDTRLSAHIGAAHT